MVIGGDDSNTNAALIAEHFMAAGAWLGVRLGVGVGLEHFMAGGAASQPQPQLQPPPQARPSRSTRYPSPSPPLSIGSHPPLSTTPGLKTRVIGLPKTIDGDLKNEHIGEQRVVSSQ